MAIIAIQLSLGNNGLINKSQTAVGKYKNEQEKENVILDNVSNKIDNLASSREDLKNITPNPITENSLIM